MDKEKQRITGWAQQQSKRIYKYYYLFNDRERYEALRIPSKIITKTYYGNLEGLFKEIVKRTKVKEKATYDEFKVNNVEELEDKIFNTKSLDLVMKRVGDEIKEAIHPRFIQSFFADVLINVLKQAEQPNAQIAKNLLGIAKQYENAPNLTKVSMTKSGSIALVKEAKRQFSEAWKARVESETIDEAMEEVLSGIETKGRGKTKLSNQLNKASKSYVGSLLEYGLTVAFEELGVKSKRTGSNTNVQGKAGKVDVKINLQDDVEVGFSAKNYASFDKKEFKERDYSFHLLNSSGGSKYSTFVENIGNLKMNNDEGENFSKTLKGLSEVLQSGDFLFSLVNEAVHSVDFKRSDPYLQFEQVIQWLAAAWIGSELYIPFKTNKNQVTVNFLLLGNQHLVPVSSVLEDIFSQLTKGARTKKFANLTGGHLKYKPLNNGYLEQIYEEKRAVNLKAPWYKLAEVRRGQRGSKEVLKNLTVTGIKLKLLFNDLTRRIN